MVIQFCLQCLPVAITEIVLLAYLVILSVGCRPVLFGEFVHHFVKRALSSFSGTSSAFTWLSANSSFSMTWRIALSSKAYLRFVTRLLILPARERIPSRSLDALRTSVTQFDICSQLLQTAPAMVMTVAVRLTGSIES